MELMKLSEVAAYVLEKTGVQRSRATIYNWVAKGVTVGGQSFRLATKSKAGQMFVSPIDLNAFLARIDQR